MSISREMKNCGTVLQYKILYGLQSHFSKQIHTKRKRLERDISNYK